MTTRRDDTSNSVRADDALVEGQSEMTPSANPTRGANPHRRNALGKGLSALMSLTAVSVEPAQKTSTNEPAAAKATEKPKQWSETEAANAPAKAEPSPPSTPATPAGEAKIPPRPFQHLPKGSDDTNTVDQGLVYLPIDRVHRNDDQPRKFFDDSELEELSKSIRESGLLQPIVVRKRKGESGPLADYEIVAGERRWRAAKLAGLSRIPAMVRHLSDKETFQLAIIENVQRADLNPIDEARAYERLVLEFGETQASVADSIGKDRASIANALRLLKLDEEIQRYLIEGKLTAGHGRALLMVEDSAQQRLLANSIMNGSLSVRAAEKLVQERRKGKGLETKNLKVDRTQSPRILEIEEQLRRRLGTKVTLVTNAAGEGELKIAFFSDAELETILEKLGV